ncbi:PepSY domain-containing protein [Ruegeria faecimaris]|uniref:PepSY domain-containing protein n=1 Tax=Ruegeria faecimaris TaxID=686389 RepID=UPI002491E8BA|nr:hypothetical protein [Ruegeria faecimaris]
MKKLIAIACLLAFLHPGEGQASARELTQSELRKATTSGSAIRLKKVIEGVEKAFGGTPVDARAFQADRLYYRILVKKPDGKIVSVIVNAQTGVVVSNRSVVGRQIFEAARAAPGKSGKGTSQGKSANKGNSGGNSGGNGGGNSGGNGGGNSGGNGGGNGGGNSGGNGGGNGGGKK